MISTLRSDFFKLFDPENLSRGTRCPSTTGKRQPPIVLPEKVIFLKFQLPSINNYQLKYLR